MEDQAHVNSLQDFTSALGSSLSTADTMMFNKRYSIISNSRQLLSSTYLEEGIVQVFIDQPVDDAFRGGIAIQCAELDADDLKELNSEMDRLEALKTYAQGLKWMRLYGGAGIIINVGQDASKPFKIEAIKKNTPLNFYAADRWELCYAPSGLGALDQFYVSTIECPYNYYGHVLHQTNVIKLMGKLAPSMFRGQFGGWGMSELEKIVRNFNQYLKHQSVTFELLDEAKLDVFGIQGFNSSIASKNGADLTAKRVQLAAQIKNFQNALVIDKEDTYEQKSIAFTGLAEVLTQIRIGLACDLRMPMTKLFGLSASGFNSGEDDIENYNCMVETEIRSKVKPGIINMLQIICQKIFGYVPESIDFSWKPLREQSSSEQSIIKTDTLNRVVSAFNNGLIPENKAVEILNHGKVFDIELQEGEAMSLDDVSNMLGKDPELGDEAKIIGRSGRD